MKHIKQCALIITILMAASFVFCGAALATKTLTVGSTSGSPSSTVSVPITLSDATDIAGIAFTLTYDPAVFTFAGLEQATKVITNGSNTSYTTDEIKADLFYQYNDEKITGTQNPTGRVMVAAATAQALTGTNTVLFNAKFTIKGGTGPYPINILQTILANPQAGYTAPSFIPALVGASPFDTGQSKYLTTNFSVYPATLTGGMITVNAQTFSIGGTVTYGASGPAAVGSTVTLKRSTNLGYVFDAQTTVGSTGSYTFTSKPAGTYQVFVTSNNPGFYNNQTDPFALSAVVTNKNVVLPAPQLLTGTVQINGAAPNLPGLMVKVMAGATTIGMYPVNVDGTFQTPGMPPGSYTMYAIYGNETSSSFTGTLNWTTLALRSIAGTISGLSGSPTVALTASSVTGKLQKTATITGNNSYIIGNLVPSADYIVSATTAGIPVTYYNGKTDITQASAVDISSADATSIDFNLGSVTTGTINGTVTGSGSEAANVGVYAFETSKFALTQVVADGAGAYSLALSPGQYEIFVIKVNGKIFYFKEGGATQDESAATLISLAAGNNLTGKDINITECTNSLTGNVTYKRLGGDPAANILITAVSPVGKAITMTGPDGSYSLSGLCGPADYRVEMNPLNSKYAVQSATVTVPPQTGGSATQNFIIDTGNVLSGKVVDAADGTTAISNAMIYLLDQQTGTLVNGRMYFSGSTGDYIIGDIANGIYSLNATHPLYRNYSESEVSITADTAKNIQMTKGAYFDVTVTDGDNSNVQLAGALIIVTRIGAVEVPVYALTNSNGNCKIYGLDKTKSDYIILAQKPGFDRKLQIAKTPADTGTPITFSLTRPTAVFTLSGTITSGCDKAPVVGAYVLLSSTTKNFFATTITDQSGQYSFANMPQANDYRFVVVASGDLRAQVQTGLNYTGATTFTNSVEIPCGSNIAGTITRAGTATIYVFLYTNDNKFVAFTTADGNGKYTFTGLTGASYKVLAVSSGNNPLWYGGASAIGDAALVSAGETGANINLTAAQ